MTLSPLSQPTPNSTSSLVTFVTVPLMQVNCVMTVCISALAEREVGNRDP